VCEADITGQVRALTPEGAAVLFQADHLETVGPGWKFTVYDHGTGLTSEFTVDDEGYLVPV
jgi:hypothetical protein